MIKIRRICSGMVLTAATALGFLGGAAQAQSQDLSYRFVSLNDIPLPEGFEFFRPVGIDGARRVCGTLSLPLGDVTIPYVGVYDNGHFQILGGPGNAYTVNERGAIGGSLVDVETGRERAAVFQDGKIKIIPPRAGEYSSSVASLSDNGIALVLSYDQNFVLSTIVYDGSRPIQVPISGSVSGINNQGEIVGITYVDAVGDRGFRYDPRTGKSTLLSPISTDPHTWALGINNHGDVLGYSFEFGGVERIGLWNQTASFQVHFTEGTPEYPTISNALLFNDDNLIVITRTTDAESYLVPSPGVRLRLTSLVEGAPARRGVVRAIRSMNQHGDMLGLGSAGFFVLLRESSSK